MFFGGIPRKVHLFFKTDLGLDRIVAALVSTANNSYEIYNTQVVLEPLKGDFPVLGAPESRPSYAGDCLLVATHAIMTRVSEFILLVNLAAVDKMPPWT